MAMSENWRYAAKSVTKYNPAFRDDNGHYKNDDWIGFFQVGKIFNGEVLTFDSYLLTEKKYIDAVIIFFRFHNCKRIVLRNVEKYDFSHYKYDDRDELELFYSKIVEGEAISVEDKEISMLVKLILREFCWAELFCSNSDDIALRFGYDFYMYFNSSQNMEEVFKQISELGLFVY